MRSRSRLGERADAFLRGAGDHVLLLELAAGLEEDERNLERQVVLQLGADVLIRAFGIAGHPFEVLLDLGVVINLEMVGGVDVPPEVRVADLVLAEIRDKRCLRERGLRREDDRGDDHSQGDRKQGPAPGAVAHVTSPRRILGHCDRSACHR